jgi:hypothetical protein
LTISLVDVKLITDTKNIDEGKAMRVTTSEAIQHATTLIDQAIAEGKDRVEVDKWITLAVFIAAVLFLIKRKATHLMKR